MHCLAVASFLRLAAPPQNIYKDEAPTVRTQLQHSPLTSNSEPIDSECAGRLACDPYRGRTATTSLHPTFRRHRPATAPRASIQDALLNHPLVSAAMLASSAVARPVSYIAFRDDVDLAERALDDLNIVRLFDRDYLGEQLSARAERPGWHPANAKMVNDILAEKAAEKMRKEDAAREKNKAERTAAEAHAANQRAHERVPKPNPNRPPQSPLYVAGKGKGPHRSQQGGSK